VKWKLTCVQCGKNDNVLINLQEHAMKDHGYTQDDHRRQTKREIDGDPGHLMYTMPDGKDWLEAERIGGNFSSGL
jgi:hypothetical protein